MDESYFDFDSLHWQAGDFNLEGADLTEMEDLLAESLQESQLPFGKEGMGQKHSDIPLEHSYAFSAKKVPLSSQSESLTNTQNGDQGNKIGLFENDTNVLSTKDDNWVDELLNIKKKEDSVNCLPLNSDPEPLQQPSSPCTQIPTQSSIEAIPPDSTIPSTSKKSRKRKASGHSTESDAGEMALDRNTKNAIAARENRLKKKQYVEGLEKKNKELEKTKKIMQDKTEEQAERISDLEREVEYLKNVLHNQSALSSLLGSLDPDTSVRLSIAGQGGKRRRGGGSKEVIPMSKGVCLHVDGQTASLEFCSLCAMKAKGGSI